MMDVQRRWPLAVLFDRDGTLVIDVPYNVDPSLVSLVPDARPALNRLRSNGIQTGVITNQSAIARGLASWDQVNAVNAHVEFLLGPFDTWQVCPHRKDDGCVCRKPAPGMVISAATELKVSPADVVVIGDIGTDIAAAAAAGSTAVLVPNPNTLPAEVAAAPHRAASLADAVQIILSGHIRSDQ
ncbi:MAG: D-glycero-alpha-D-manno-heptose-1,7-bisphosphate 7-phosphatase [Actinomycetota bacterium]